jgi:hypothetical protein
MACPAPHDEQVTISKGYGVELAAAYEFDASGALVSVIEYVPGPLPLPPAAQP